MSNYIGVRCPVCDKKFTEADDIVVCPVCGAPHHRECYMRTNQCAFVAEHMSGKEWSNPSAAAPPGNQGESQAKTCPRCGAANPGNQIFCQVCGNPLSLYQSGQPYGAPPFQNVDTISMAYGGLSPEEELEGETVRDLACYVGSGSSYYLPRFYGFSKQKRTVSFNPFAFLFSYLYFFYRKMYGVGIVLLVLALASSIPNCLLTYEMIPMIPAMIGVGAAGEVNQVLINSLTRLGNITSTSYLMIKFVVALFANHIYFNHVLHGVHRVRAGAGNAKLPQQYAELLVRAGGCNRTVVVVMIAALVFGVFFLSSFMLYLSA